MDKVLFISGSYPPDKCAIGYYLSNFLKHLKDDIEVVLALPGRNRQLGYDFHHFPDELFGCIKEKNIRLIHWQLITQGFRYKVYFLKYFFLLKLKRGIRQVSTIHDFSTLHFLNKIRLMIPILLSDYVIVTNEIDYDIIKKFNKNISIIPISSNIEMKKNIKILFDDKIITLLFWGFPVKNRELDKILDAMFFLKKRGIKFKLRILPGFYNISERDKNFYLKKISDLGLDDNIEITGFLNEDEMRDKLLSSDLALLFYSDGITFRRTTFLGIAGAGIPYLVNFGTNTPAILKSMINCSLVEPFNAEKIADKIIDFINNKDSFYKEYEKLNNFVIEKFSWQRIKEEHLKIYKKFLNI